MGTPSQVFGLTNDMLNTGTPLRDRDAINQNSAYRAGGAGT